ncbi:MAG: TonB-dependent receptor domain-containing protein, partial [bacterium]
MNRFTSYRRQLLAGAALAAAVAFASPALAQSKQIEIAPQSLATALYQLGSQTGEQIIFSPDLADAKMSPGVSSADNIELALNQLLEGTGLSYKRTADAFMIVRATDPQSGSAAGGGADGTVQALIVTAQKREENIQDVPIAISAFSEKTLEEQKIEGGFDLLKAIPNVTFSKNNFTSYNFSIRGIGTKAVSASTDPGVAVSFNNVALIQNRLFEQEYFDIERVEVLRGPQGTLYGRNATAGVINVISAKANLREFSGWVKGEVGNYHTKRISAMINVPLVEDKLAIRIAGALTDRVGYDYNTITNHAINGRDLWSTRATVDFKPNDKFKAELVWERFNEDDNRSRTGKQLCHRDDGLAKVGNTDIVSPWSDDLTFLSRAMFSTGCKPGSLYDEAAFGTPNGLAMPFVFTILQYTATDFWPIGYDRPRYVNGEWNQSARPVSIIDLKDPYGGLEQSRNLREIASFRDPVYRANADVVQLNLQWDLTDHISVFSQTVYDNDGTYSFQDYNRFNTLPIFNDTSNLYAVNGWEYANDPLAKSPYASMVPGGTFCDPQLGCTNRMAGFDISRADATQFTQELRIQSNFDGPLNFSAGANFTKFDVDVDYYVMYNLITAAALSLLLFNHQGDYTKCAIAAGGSFTTPWGTFTWPAELDPPISMEDPNIGCPYIDPNPVEHIAGDGHNYYRSYNPYHLRSAAAFGELYWQATDNLKITAGLRYTRDRKRFTPYPTQVLMTPMIFIFGTSFRGLQAEPDIKQTWGEFTGRLGFDWKPDLSWTDETMIYGFYSRGYKGGGANPPRVSMAPALLQYLPYDYSPTFEPEFVNAYEVGAKNTLLDGALRFNTDAFFYDYSGYQVSKVVDRSVANENFDATVWGLEFETMFAPSRQLRFIANLGYLDTKIADGAKSIDVMNRTQGDPNYIVLKPFPTFPSNCVAPLKVVEPTVNEIGWLTSICQMGIPDMNNVPDP